MLLEKEGLVDVPPRRRPRVATLGAPAIREIYEVRAALVGMVASIVAVSASAAQLEELKALVATMQQACDAGDTTSYLWTSLEFHERNTLIANNETGEAHPGLACPAHASSSAPVQPLAT